MPNATTITLAATESTSVASSTESTLFLPESAAVLSTILVIVMKTFVEPAGIVVPTDLRVFGIMAVVSLLSKVRIKTLVGLSVMAIEEVPSIVLMVLVQDIGVMSLVESVSVDIVLVRTLVSEFGEEVVHVVDIMEGVRFAELVLYKC